MTRLHLGFILIISMVIIGTLAPWIAPQDPGLMNLEHRYESPSLAHPFGLDQNGSDVLAQVAYGARVSLIVALSVVGMSLCIGLLIGSIAGYLGGWPDLLLMRALDIAHAFPGFLLALSLVAVLGPSVPNLIFAMTLSGWTSYARLARGEVLHLKNRDYVLAATATGATTSRILFKHIWPNLLSLLAVQATFGMAGTVLAESGLSFLGLGAPAQVPTWGALLNSGRRVLAEAPHVSLFPGLAILILVLGFNLAGDGIRRWLDPRR